MRKSTLSILLLCLLLFVEFPLFSQQKIDTLRYKPYVWKSEVPADSPFKLSRELTGIKLLGLKSGFHCGDTWYPTWAADGNLYSPWTDGTTNGVNSWSSGFF